MEWLILGSIALLYGSCYTLAAFEYLESSENLEHQRWRNRYEDGMVNAILTHRPFHILRQNPDRVNWLKEGF